MDGDAVDVFVLRRFPPHRGAFNDGARRGDGEPQRLCQRHGRAEWEPETTAAIADVDHVCLDAFDRERDASPNFHAWPLPPVGSLVPTHVEDLNPK